ncbi:MAG: 50S ribosomal protein L22 [Actinomycetota bacterium]
MSDKRFSYASTGLVRAEARHVRSSPRKVRLVLEDIRGRSVLDARRQLLFSPRDAAKDVELVLRSAVTNAEVNHGLSPDDLVVHAAYANEGFTIKRFKPRARGRASRIRKRTSHIVILLRSTTGEIIVQAGASEAAAAPKKASSDCTRAKRVAASKQAQGA